MTVLNNATAKEVDRGYLYVMRKEEESYEIEIAIYWPLASIYPLQSRKKVDEY